MLMVITIIDDNDICSHVLSLT